MSDNSWYEKGELPPVGEPCIVSPHNTQWGFGDCAEHKCKVISYYNDYVWLDLLVPGIPVSTRIDKVSFIPIKTERELAIEAAVKKLSITFYHKNELASMAGLLFDAGLLRSKNES